MKNRVLPEPVLHVDPSWLDGMNLRWRLRRRRRGGHNGYAYAAWWASGAWWYGGRLPKWRKGRG